MDSLNKYILIVIVYTMIKDNKIMYLNNYDQWDVQVVVFFGYHLNYNVKLSIAMC